VAGSCVFDARVCVRVRVRVCVFVYVRTAARVCARARVSSGGWQEEEYLSSTDLV
jgi:hypothetical protein